MVDGQPISPWVPLLGTGTSALKSALTDGPARWIPSPSRPEQSFRAVRRAETASSSSASVACSENHVAWCRIGIAPSCWLGPGRELGNEAGVRRVRQLFVPPLLEQQMEKQTDADALWKLHGLVVHGCRCWNLPADVGFFDGEMGIPDVFAALGFRLEFYSGSSCSRPLPAHRAQNSHPGESGMGESCQTQSI